MREVKFDKTEVAEMAIYICALTKEGANYKVRSTNDGWCILVTGV